MQLPWPQIRDIHRHDLAPRWGAMAVLVISLTGLAPAGDRVADDEGPETKDFQADAGAKQAPLTGFTNLLAGGSLLDNWQGRYTDTFTERRMTRLRQRRLQRLADMDMTVHWRITGSMLAYDGRGKSIRSLRQYGDFELFVDWRVSKGGSGTVFLRGIPAIRIGDTSLEHLGAAAGSGGLYHNRTNPSQPTVKADRDVGQWNRFYIKMVGSRVTVQLNGQVVVDNVVLENPWTPGAVVQPGGSIGFEGGGSPLQFANIYIREIPR